MSAADHANFIATEFAGRVFFLHDVVIPFVVCGMRIGKAGSKARSASYPVSNVLSVWPDMPRAIHNCFPTVGEGHNLFGRSRRQYAAASWSVSPARFPCAWCA